MEVLGRSVHHAAESVKTPTLTFQGTCIHNVCVCLYVCNPITRISKAIVYTDLRAVVVSAESLDSTERQAVISRVSYMLKSTT